MAIEYDTIIPLDKMGDTNQTELLDFTKNILKLSSEMGITNRFHTIEAHQDPLNNEQVDRIYLRNSKLQVNRCYLFIQLENGSEKALVGFGEFQHSGGEPTWGEQYMFQSSECAQAVVTEILDHLN